MMWIRNHIQDFSCLGADCPDHCCGGWNVPVSEEDKSRLHQHMGSEADEVIQPNGNSWIMKPKTGGCFSQCETGLCTIQQRFGHDALPLICASYPRALNRLGERLEMGGFLSCPEIARIVMTHPIPQGTVSQSPQVQSAIDFESDDVDLPYHSDFLRVRKDLIDSIHHDNFLLGLYQLGAMVELSPAFFNRTSSSSDWDRLYKRAADFKELPPYQPDLSVQIWSKVIALAQEMLPKTKRYSIPSKRLESVVNWSNGFSSPTAFLQMESNLWPKLKAMNYLPFRRYLEHDWTVRWHLHAPDMAIHWEQSLFKFSLLRLFLLESGSFGNQALVNSVYSIERLVEHTAWKTELSSVFRSFRLPMRTLTRHLLPKEIP